MKILFIILNILLIHLIIADDPMNYIIDNIYLGDINAAADEAYLKEHNITTVVNCAISCKSNYTDIKFIELRLYDDKSQILFPKLEVAYNFIKKNSKKNANILVHCKCGISRSTSLVVFYLMKERGWDYDRAIDYIRERRPIVQPNPGFEEQLRNYYDKYINK